VIGGNRRYTATINTCITIKIIKYENLVHTRIPPSNAAYYLV
jgi:hypothetical protein